MKGIETKIILGVFLLASFELFAAEPQWESVELPAQNLAITKVAAAQTGNTLLVGTEENGILVSHDQGRSWVSIAANPFNTNDHITSVAVNPGNEMHFVAGKIDGSVAVSVDGGSSWHITHAEGKPLDVFFVGQTGEVHVILLVGESYKRIRSLDGGFTWQQTPAVGGIAVPGQTPLWYRSVQSEFHPGAPLSAHTEESHDLGASWAISPSIHGLRVAIAFDVSNGNTIYLLTLSTIGSGMGTGYLHNLYVSQDRGANWSKKKEFSTKNYHEEHQYVLIDPAQSSTLVMLDEGPTFSATSYSVDSGATWREFVTTSRPAYIIQALWQDGENDYLWVRNNTQLSRLNITQPPWGKDGSALSGGGSIGPLVLYFLFTILGRRQIMLAKRRLSAGTKI